MATTIQPSLSHYFLLGFGFQPTHRFEVASRLFLLGEETLLEQGSFLSFTSSIKSYGCVALDSKPIVTILSLGYPKISIPWENLSSTIEPYSIDQVVKLLMGSLKEEGIALQGKAMFIDTTAPSKVMLSSSLSFAILVLESLLYKSTKRLSLPQKARILIHSLKKGLNLHFTYLDILSMLEGGISYGEPTDIEDGFIDHLPASSLSPYRLLLIHLPLNPYLTSAVQQQWSKAFSTYRLIEHVPSLRQLDHESTSLQKTKLNLQYGEKTMAPVYYFYQQQNRTKLAYFGLKNKNTSRFETMMQQSSDAFNQDLQGLSFASDLDQHLEKTVLYLKKKYPSIMVKLLSKPFQGPLLVCIPKEQYRTIKKDFTTRFYKKNIEDIHLVNTSILSYKL